MNALTKLLETPERFRAWLEGKEPDAVVGQAGAVGSCPLACFLIQCGPKVAFPTRVYPGIFSTPGAPAPWVIHGRGKGRSLPHWAALIAQTVDTRGAVGKKVTAAEVLAILADVEQQP